MKKPLWILFIIGFFPHGIVRFFPFQNPFLKRFSLPAEFATTLLLLKKLNDAEVGENLFLGPVDYGHLFLSFYGLIVSLSLSVFFGINNHGAENVNKNFLEK